MNIVLVHSIHHHWPGLLIAEICSKSHFPMCRPFWRSLETPADLGQGQRRGTVVGCWINAINDLLGGAVSEFPVAGDIFEIEAGTSDRDVSVSGNGRMLRMKNRAPGRDSYTELPLPAYLQVVAATAESSPEAVSR